MAGHHAHIARGIELFEGKPIYHGLGNGCVVTHALAPAQDHPEWAERRKRMFGFEPDPAYPLAPFHPEAVNGMIGRLLWHEDGSLSAGLIPVWFEPPGRPAPAGGQAEAILQYHMDSDRKAGLPELSARPDGICFMLKVSPGL